MFPKHMPPLLQDLIILLFLGFASWAIGKLTFLQQPIRELLQGVLLLICVVWVLFILYSLVSGAPFPVIFR
jgi:hypothetical protein